MFTEIYPISAINDLNLYYYLDIQFCYNSPIIFDFNVKLTLFKILKSYYLKLIVTKKKV